MFWGGQRVTIKKGGAPTHFPTVTLNSPISIVVVAHLYPAFFPNRESFVPV